MENRQLLLLLNQRNHAGCLKEPDNTQDRGFYRRQKEFLAFLVSLINGVLSMRKENSINTPQSCQKRIGNQLTLLSTIFSLPIPSKRRKNGEIALSQKHLLIRLFTGKFQ